MVANGTTTWLKSILIFAATWLGLVVVLHPTFENMAAIWASSTDTYSYGYIILPITLWLLWRERHRLARLPAQPDWRMLAPILVGSMLWLMGRLSGIQVVEQYALIAIAILTVPTFLGWPWFKQCLFPFLFLLLMVPNGDFLLPRLIDYTADFTTWFVRLLGVPLYREGPYLTLPTGQWVVVEACGGLRYLTAGITLGLLFAYLTYLTPWKQLAFVAFMISVALLANGLRAVMVVLVGHYSNMTMMIGADHLWFGWGWFGVVMIMTFWIGGIWREETEIRTNRLEGNVVAPHSPFAIALAVILGVSLFAAWEHHLANRPGQNLALALPPGQQAWVRVGDAAIAWVPEWKNPDASLVGSYRQHDDKTVLLYVAYYARQRQGAELISHDNMLHNALRGKWEFLGATTRQTTSGGKAFAVAEAHLRDPRTGQRLLVWQWYQAGSRTTSNLYLIKLALIANQLVGRSNAGASVVLAAPYHEDEPRPEARLQAFLTAYGDGIRGMLDPE